MLPIPRATLLRARLLFHLLTLAAALLLALTLTSIWGNLWLVISNVAVGVFHGQFYIRWGFDHPILQILSPGIHTRWFNAGWDWHRPLYLRGVFNAVNISLLLPLIALTLGALWSFRRHRALRAKGRCPTCLYDLTGLTNPARCPECGRSLLPIPT